MKPPSSLVSAIVLANAGPRQTPNCSKSCRVVGRGLKVLVSCKSCRIAMRMVIGLVDGQIFHGPVEPVERFIYVCQGHRRAETMVASRAAVIVKVDSMTDGRCHEAQHPVAMMLDRISISP